MYTIRSIMVWSKFLRAFLWASANAPNLGLSATPKHTGTKTWTINLNMTSPSPFAPSTFSRNKLIQTGVRKTPIRLDTLALKIAAGIFPPAMETMTTDDDTVEGSVAKKKDPIHKYRPFPCADDAPNKCITASIIKGNTTKVEICTSI